MEQYIFTSGKVVQFKKMLLTKRHELLDIMDELQNEALRKSSKSDKTGDLSNMPIHMADAGSDNFEQELNLGHMERERQLIREIDNALEKIEHNKYGICESDGKVISKKRLKAIPWARYCLSCETERVQRI